MGDNNHFQSRHIAQTSDQCRPNPIPPTALRRTIFSLPDPKHVNAIGLMGYSNATARDRDKGIFQRLRVAPLTAWSIMASRLTVQLAMIMLVTTGVFVAGHYADNITLQPAGYAVGLVMAFIGRLEF